MKEATIGNTVADTLARETGLVVRFQPDELNLQTGKTSNWLFDGRLLIKSSSSDVSLLVEIKRNPRRALIPSLKQRIGEKMPWVLLADYLSQPLQKELRENQINYVDSAGNAFVDQDGLFLLVEGRKRESRADDKSYKPIELKALMCLLIQPDLLTCSYSQLEAKLSISRATFSGLFTKLKDKGFLKGETQDYRFHNCTRLQDEIAQPFSDMAKRKLLTKRYEFAKPDGYQTWSSWKLSSDTRWGGEPAISLLDDFLIPEEWTLYTKASAKDLLKYLPIIPDSEGPISVFQQFWPDEIESGPIKNTVPEILIYTDLIGSGHGRNKQAAQRIKLPVC